MMSGNLLVAKSSSRWAISMPTFSKRASAELGLTAGETGWAPEPEAGAAPALAAALEPEPEFAFLSGTGRRWRDVAGRPDIYGERQGNGGRMMT